MKISIADQYYLKAYGYYPYWSEQVVENLNYALSYDDEHAPAYCLMGMVYMYQIKDYHQAVQCFSMALQCDLNYVDTYKYYSLLRIWMGEYDKATRLINYGLKVRGMDQTILLSYKAIIHEYRGEFKEAKSLLKKIKTLSVNTQMIAKIKTDLSRIKSKSNAQKAQLKKRKVKLRAV